MIIIININIIIIFTITTTKILNPDVQAAFPACLGLKARQLCGGYSVDCSC